MEARISGTTKLFGLIGSPVSHSASPAMQNYGFQACGVDGAYLAFDIKEEEVPEFVKSMRLLNIQGCNVTMPNKTAAAQNMDELSPAAELIGAVNTIVNRDGKLYGHITDGEGFVANLKDHGIGVEGKDIVIFGAGGAATPGRRGGTGRLGGRFRGKRQLPGGQAPGDPDPPPPCGVRPGEHRRCHRSGVPGAEL